jgi:putative FmdB family regulatory protein
LPCYTYECCAKKCGLITEVLQTLHEPPLKKCPICKRGKVIKIISLPARPVVPEHPLEAYAKIKREAKETAQKIMRGDQETIADIYGEDVASGKPKKELPKPKMMKDVKKGIVKREKK